MLDILNNNEKIEIINSHKKNIAYNLYNLQISIIEENSKSNPSQSILSNLDIQLEDAQNQISALDLEITKLTPTPLA